MKVQGVEKISPGSSWIEMDSKIHLFEAFDKSHPYLAKIYVVLGELNGQLKLARYQPERYPDIAKFQRMPLQFTEDLDILFSDTAAIGAWAYTPSLGVMPHTDKSLEEFHTPHDAEFHDDADLEVVYPFDLNKKTPIKH
ncbi:Pentatricopeptide repeat-containing protein [Camellia lanceoleosa]|nr:Pentatricopeptide repeat-containing protein [Camellia lanceoleosa]